MSSTDRATDHVVEVNGARIHYRQLGDPGAPPVIVLHGIMGHAREWDILLEQLAPHFHVIAVDQRGHGESDWAETYTAGAFGRDLASLVVQLDLAPAHVVGHSLGAMAAMVAAAELPWLFDRLVLVDIGPESLDTPFGRELPSFLERMATASYANVDDAVQEWIDGDPLALEAPMRHYVEHCLVRGADGRLVWRYDGAGLARFPTDGVTAEELWRAVDDLTASTLLIRGEHSPLLSRPAAERMAQRLGPARLIEIAGGAHDLGVEQPQAVAVAVLAFLEGDHS